MKTNFTKMKAVVLLLAVLLIATGCPKPVTPKVPIVNVLENSVAIGYNMAVMYAEVTDNGGAAITEWGFCYGKEGDSMDTLLCQAGYESFSVELNNLSPLTAYTCQAFAGNEAGRGFSSKFSFTTEVDTVPRVKTWYVRELTYCSALVSGQVLGNGGQTVEERGVCYGTDLRPTVDGKHVAAGSGVGPFDCPLPDLSPETKYFVRAYAVCTKGVYYGEQLEFDTKPLPMEVRTISVSDVTATRIKAEGEVVRDGGLEVSEYGFCWGTEHNPTIEGLHLKTGMGMGEFSHYFSGLERGRTHYVRAYAVNEEDVAYGNEIEFVPDDPFTSWPNGTLPGLFSVSEDHQVRFSQGNLQYRPSTCVWRFAEHQWDYVGGVSAYDFEYGMPFGTVYENGVMCDNVKVWKYYDGWVDLFCWGTSGWNNGNVYYHPYDYAGSVHNFFGPLGNFDLTGDYAQSDWGVYNTISNGGTREWRTPTADEFYYLLVERTTPSGIRFAKAEVAGVRGMIVLPDDWSASNYPLARVNVDGTYFANIVSGSEWLDVLEPAGAVFLPAAGYRWAYYSGITEVYYMDNSEAFLSECGGRYWTVTHVDDNVNSAVALKFWGVYGYLMYVEQRCIGCSVRLVSDE